MGAYRCRLGHWLTTILVTGAALTAVLVGTELPASASQQATLLSAIHLDSAYISPTVPYLGIWEILRLSVGNDGVIRGTLSATMGHGEWSPSFVLTGTVRHGHVSLAGRDTSGRVWRFTGIVSQRGLSGAAMEPWRRTVREVWCPGATPSESC